VRSPWVPGESLSVGFGLVAWFPTVCAASVPRAVGLASDYRLDARGRLYGWWCRVISAGTGWGRGVVTVSGSLLMGWGV
jgi:hypothetical protein